MLDLGQTALLMLYLFFFITPSRWVISGILLGLLAGSKFWGVPLYFVTFFFLFHFRLVLKHWKQYFLQIATGVMVFSGLYLPAFIIQNGEFNLVLFELKTIKYWLNHSASSFPGASFVLFTTGYFKSWWGEGEIIRTNIWSVLWPITLVISLKTMLDSIRRRKFQENKFLISLIPILYLVYLGLQIPFPRYFMVILPFLYLISAEWIVKTFFVQKHLSRLLRKKST